MTRFMSAHISDALFTCCDMSDSGPKFCFRGARATAWDHRSFLGFLEILVLSKYSKVSTHQLSFRVFVCVLYFVFASLCLCVTGCLCRYLSLYFSVPVLPVVFAGLPPDQGCVNWRQGSRPPENDLNKLKK